MQHDTLTVLDATPEIQALADTELVKHGAFNFLRTHTYSPPRLQSLGSNLA